MYHHHGEVEVGKHTLHLAVLEAGHAFPTALSQQRAFTYEARRVQRLSLTSELRSRGDDARARTCISYTPPNAQTDTHTHTHTHTHTELRTHTHTHTLSCGHVVMMHALTHTRTCTLRHTQTHTQSRAYMVTMRARQRVTGAGSMTRAQRRGLRRQARRWWAVSCNAKLLYPPTGRLATQRQKEW